MNKTRIALLIVIFGRTFPKTRTSDFTPGEVFSSHPGDSPDQIAHVCLDPSKKI